MKLDVQKWNLLKHPFYRSWEDGSLSRDTLKTYAAEYFQHVSAFPRYLSRMHSHIDDIKTRQILLENLIDEEKGEKNHPQLWKAFSKALGWNEAELQTYEAGPELENIKTTFFRLAEKSPASALGALYAYESQIPEIAEFKLEALKKFYIDANNKEALEFFEVHRIADSYHRKALEDVFESFSDTEKKEAQSSAEEAAQALWNFLDSMQRLEMAA